LVKKSKPKSQRPLTKHQLSLWQRQQRRQRITKYVGIVIIASVVIILALGWYLGMYRPMRQTAIRVNDTEFSMEYYVEMLKIQGQGQSEEAMSYMASITARNIAQIELVRREAQELGVSVSDEEVLEQLKEAGLPESPAYVDVGRYQLLMDKLLYGHFDDQVPESAPQANMNAAFLESESQALDVSEKIESGEDFGEVAGGLSLEPVTAQSEGELGWHPENILLDYYVLSAVPVEYAFSADAGAISPPLYDGDLTKNVAYWLIKVVSWGEDEEEGDANVHAILLDNEALALDIKDRLDGGADFATLAREYSLLDGVEENGGNLGMVSEGDQSIVFDEFVFNSDPEPGKLSEPLRDETQTTEGGYWLVQVVDRAGDRALSDDDRNILKNQVMDEWIASLWEDPDYDIDDSMLDEDSMRWAVEQALKD